MSAGTVAAPTLGGGLHHSPPEEEVLAFLQVSRTFW